MTNPIGWCTETWNPITGCSPVSPACDHCYAARMAQRLKGRYGYPADEPFRVTFHPEQLDEPRHWRKHRRVFVVSMGDLFHPDVRDEWIFEIWRVAARCPEHDFLWLTKRPERMREWFRLLADTGPADAPPVMWRDGKYAKSFGATPQQAEAVKSSGRGRMLHAMLERWGEPPEGFAYPLYDWQEGERWWPTVLGNLWLGVTAENQEQADKRIPVLLETPAVKRFVSIEPMLGPVDLSAYLLTTATIEGEPAPAVTALIRRAESPKLSWVIVGGENGPGARPMHPAWVRSLRDQCQAAGVPFWFKGWGEWKPIGQMADGESDALAAAQYTFGLDDDVQPFHTMFRVGKKAAGALLDGREWREVPA